MSSDVTTQIQNIAETLRRNGQSLGLAESCTGGLLSSWFTAEPGVSDFFQGAVVSYSRQVKADVLEVPWHTMQVHGEVSTPVARAMAEGARYALDCDWSLSITGIAGPTGGSEEKPVGTVCFAVVGPSFVETRLRRFEASKRQVVQQNSAQYGLELLLECLQN